MPNRGRQDNDNDRGSNNQTSRSQGRNEYWGRDDRGGGGNGYGRSGGGDQYGSQGRGDDYGSEGRGQDRYQGRNDDRDNRRQYAENRRDHGMQENRWDQESNQRYGGGGGGDRWNERNDRNASSGYGRNQQGGYGRGDMGGGYNEGGYDNQGTSGGDWDRDFDRNARGGSGQGSGQGGWGQGGWDQGREQNRGQNRMQERDQGGGDQHAGYRSYRERQMRQLDDDYNTYRTEHDQDFDEEHFGSWRTERSGDSASKSSRSGSKAKSGSQRSTAKASAKSARGKTSSTKSSTSKRGGREQATRH